MYSYQVERPSLFTENGSVAVMKARDNAMRLLDEAGAFNGMKIFFNVSTADTFQMMAVLDRLVEIGDIREITGANVRGQDRVFVKAI